MWRPRRRRSAGVIAAAARRQEETPSEEGKLSQAESLEIAVEGYVYGYPLITSEMTRRIMTNVDRAARLPRSDGPFDEHAGVSQRGVSRRDRAERRHALFGRVARPAKGALGVLVSGARRTLCVVSDV